MEDEIWHEGWQEEPEPESHDDHEEDTPPLIAAGRQAIADIYAVAAEAAATVVARIKEQTGETIAVRNPSIMDATRPQLQDAAVRAGHALEAMDLVLGVTWGDCGTLGELMRDEIWTEEDREEIAFHLSRAGLS